MKLDDDDFTLFGLPQRHAQDAAALDARWRALQADVHPDRFAADSPAARRVAMQWAVRVNEAHARLKSPLRRAAYLCELRGTAVDAERNTAMPAAFLTQQMQWREALDDAADAQAVAQIDAAIASSESSLMADVQRHLDTEHDAAAAAAGVRALMFFSRFREDIARRLDALDSPAGR